MLLLLLRTRTIDVSGVGFGPVDLTQLATEGVLGALGGPVDLTSLAVESVLEAAGGALRLTQVAVEVIRTFKCADGPVRVSTDGPVHVAIRRLRRSAHIAHEAYTLTHHGFYLDLETGVGLTAGDAADPPVLGADPQVMLRYSDDGGHTWSDEEWVSAGLRGRYTWRAEWRRLGRSRDRVFEVSMSDPVKWVLIGAWLDVERGSS